MIGSLVAAFLVLVLTGSLACSGNGMTDPFKMFLSYYDIQCTPVSVEPFLDIASRVAMKLMVIHLLIASECSQADNACCCIASKMRKMDEGILH
jgi:hypothetical protein